jgi:hypothetical protein
MVAAPLLLLFLSVFGIAVNTYAANVAQDVAIEAARYGSLADTTLADAQAVAMQSLESALGSQVRAEVLLSRSATPCATQVTVRLRGVSLGLLSTNLGIEENAVEICEIQF